jgi:RNA polymerase sigma-70 factor (ECF subfamily)
MASHNGDTRTLIEEWHQGDSRALDQLLETHLPWIRERVHRRLGDLLREKAETQDLVQDALMQFLRYGPRFVITSDAQFRALLARIVENVLRDKLDFYRARRREIAREQPLPTDTVLSLDPRGHTRETPGESMEHQEREAWVRLALELLDPDERAVLVLREWDDLTFRQIGARLGISEQAAKMRHHRALAHLAKAVGSLRKGKLDELLG